MRHSFCIDRLLSGKSGPALAGMSSAGTANRLIVSVLASHRRQNARVGGFQIWMLLVLWIVERVTPGHGPLLPQRLLWGSTFGHPSNSWASCNQTCGIDSLWDRGECLRFWG